MQKDVLVVARSTRRVASSRPRLAAAVAGVLSVAASGPALAASADTGLLQEIVVTAQKRESSLQDVPFSIAAISGESIRNAGATNITELARNVAGLTITDLGPGQSQVAIRGISAGQVVRDQPGVKESVGLYLDESPVSIALFTPDLDLYDLERVEVLRGPQGTLFGAGSSSGTVRYITAQPQFDAVSGSVEVTGHGGESSGAGGWVKGAINVPLGDTVAMRAVGYHNRLAGFVDSVYPGRGLTRDVNDGTKSGGRLAFLFKPNDSLSITPRIVYQKLETDGYPRVDVWNILGNPFTTSEPPVTPGERAQVTQLQEGLEDEFKMADLKIEFGFGGLTLTSVTTYVDREILVVRDASQLTGSVTLDIGGTPAEARFASPLLDTTDFKSWSQEVRLQSSGDGAFEWLVGAFYNDVERKYGQTLPTPGYDAMLTRLFNVTSATFNAPPDTPYYSRFGYDFKQFALFGEATYRFTDQFALTAGLRYYDFEEDRLTTFAGVFADPVILTDEPGSVSSNGFSPRLILTYRASDDVQFSAQASRGFRLGGINDPLLQPLCSPQDLVTFGNRPTWDDEEVTNFELGTKTRWAGGRVQFNAAVFLSDIDGLQAIADAGTCSSRIVLNADARSVGAEAELFLRPTEAVDFGISATYADATITKTQTDASGNVIAGIRDGNRLPTAPKFQAAATAGFTWDATPEMEGFARFTFQHVGSSYTQLADQVPNFGLISRSPTRPAGSARMIDFGALTITDFEFAAELPSYDIANFRIGVRKGAWELAAFVNNLFDERALLSLDRERGRTARVGYLTNPPQTYGVTFRYSL